MADEDMQIASDEQFEIRAGAWDLLLNAAALMVEELEAAAQDVRGGVQAAETAIGEWMPRRFLLRYDAAFADGLLAGAKTLRRRLDEGRAAGWAYPHEGFLNSVAEEMLMAIIIDLADERSSSPQESEDLEALRSLSFEDRDFEWLYDLTHDGVTDDPEIKARVGFANLGFDDWFEPFR
jgi:hypothetical protein